jgi:hypothetical protein
LIHYPTGQYTLDDLTEDAKKQFEGPVTQAEDYMSLDFN